MPSNASVGVEKKTYGYRERDETQRSAFQEQLSQKPAHQIVYVDKVGCDNRHDYSYGYAPVGEQLYALKCGKQTQRISSTAARRGHQLCSPLTFNLFETWLQTSLLPTLNPSDLIVLDNASFHQSYAIEQSVADAGCELSYLPPYSPDLNPTEHNWAGLKKWMSQHLNDFEHFHDCVDATFTASPNVIPQCHKDL